MSQTVNEWVSSHCRYGATEFEDQIRTYKDRLIVEEYDGCVVPFPQTKYRYRNVMTWCLLDDGSAIGFNESPRSGFSFPRSGKRITDRYLEHFKDKLDEARKANNGLLKPF